METETRQRKPFYENNNLIEDANQNVGIFWTFLGVDGL